MLIHNPIFTGSILLNGTDISKVSTVSSDSSSFAARITSNEARTGSFATTGSNVFNGSQTITGSLNVSGSLTVTGSAAFEVGTLRIGNGAGSHTGFSFSGDSLLQSNNNPVTFQGALRVNSTAGNPSYISGSGGLALGKTTSNTGFALDVNGNILVTGSLTSTGTITAQTLVVQTITSSVDFVTGSTRYGSNTGNTHQFTGSLLVTGSQTINGTLGVAVGGVTELNVQQTGVTLGNVIGDVHRVTGSLNISGSQTVNGNVGIGTSDLGPDGLSLSVQNNYSWSEGSGNAYAVLFRQRNSAATVVASGYKRSNTAAFASSFGTSMARAAIAVGSNNGSIAFFTDTATNVANGTDMTPTERVTIINSGNVGIGTINPSTLLDVRGSGEGIYVARIAGSVDFGAHVRIQKARGSVASPTIVANGDTLGTLTFEPHNGTIHTEQVGIRAIVNGTVSAGSIPTDLFFSAGASGTTAANERMRITSDGLVGIVTSGHTIGNTLQLGRVFGLVQDINSGYIQANMSNAGNYYVSQFATRIHLDSAIGEINFLNAPSGTAGTAVSLVNRMKIDASGRIIGTVNGTNGQLQLFQSNSGTNVDSMLYLFNNRNATSSYNFAKFFSGYPDNTQDVEFVFRGDGTGFSDGGWTTPASDYAEYFESLDGTALQIGTTVVLENGKVRQATESDTNIIGVIRPKNASLFLGNNAEHKWNQKYLKDDFGAYILDEEGMRTLNPDYDSELEYIPREKRDEWNIVGLVGQVPTLKQQPVNPNWIKMHNISDTVEMWLIK
jgi:hypothetical protein